MKALTQLNSWTFSKFPRKKTLKQTIKFKKEAKIHRNWHENNESTEVFLIAKKIKVKKSWKKIGPKQKTSELASKKSVNCLWCHSIILTQCNVYTQGKKVTWAASILTCTWVFFSFCQGDVAHFYLIILFSIKIFSIQLLEFWNVKSWTSNLHENIL